jgi:NhaB family Na+:H+ antiporter
MQQTLSRGLVDNFLGNAPVWYKLTIIGFLILNPILLAVAGPFITGWALIGQFIFTLALALKCYPLQPGGLLAIEAVVIGLTTPDAVYVETLSQFEVILLLMFMVAGIYFMKDLLLFAFTKVLLNVKSKPFFITTVFTDGSSIISFFRCFNCNSGPNQCRGWFLFGLS